MFTIGNEELGTAIKETTVCPNCGELHTVEYGSEVLKAGLKIPSRMLGFVKCDNGKSYLVAIDGKEIYK